MQLVQHRLEPNGESAVLGSAGQVRKVVLKHLEPAPLG
jgi:hypothetical protein